MPLRLDPDPTFSVHRRELRILIVDDDDVDRMVVRRAAAKSMLNIDLVEASDLRSGAEELKRGNLDCVLVDLHLPDGEGLELLRVAPSVPMLVLTGADPGRAAEALSAGAQDYIVKEAINPVMLARTIRYAMERKQAERMRSQLAHADRLASLGRLAASVAHEINNPAAFVFANLTTLGGHLEILAEAAQAWSQWESLSDELRGRVEAINREELSALVHESQMGVTRIREIVRQLRNFARGSDEDEDVAEVRLNEVIEWAAALTRNEVQHRASFQVELDGALPTFKGRAGKIAQVATNLILNAAQAIPEGDVAGNVVRVITRRGEGSAQLIVEDSGPGMAPRVKERALEPFFTTKAPGEGTGLGLPIALEIVRTHGGTMVFDDRPGGGARIVVTIPSETGLEVAKPIESGIPPAQDPSVNLRIMLIDDEAPIRRAYVRLLRPHRVDAFTADEALEIIEERQDEYDLILCDLMMPGRDGIDVFEELGRIDLGLQERVVFCTGGAFGDRARGFLESVPNLVLEKPVSRDAILAAARSIRAA